MSSTIILHHANSFVIGPAAINNKIEYRNRPEEEHSKLSDEQASRWLRQTMPAERAHRWGGTLALWLPVSRLTGLEQRPRAIPRSDLTHSHTVLLSSRLSPSNKKF